MSRTNPYARLPYACHIPQGTWLAALKALDLPAMQACLSHTPAIPQGAHASSAVARPAQVLARAADQPPRGTGPRQGAWGEWG